jgi:arabinose-5-phosphate isomerase
MGLRAILPNSDSLEQARIHRGQQVLLAGAEIIRQLVDRLDDQFSAACECLVHCRGQVIVTGIGKAGIIGRKLAASLTSTGTASHFLHPAEAVHGDLGCVRDGDVVIVLSYSGETEEVTRLLPTLRTRASILIAITAGRESSLGKQADVVLELGYHTEACSLGLAPSTTTTGMLALCDALTITVCEERGFTREQFARLHPAGSLGRQLMNVCEAMRPLIDCRVALDSLTVRQVMVQVSRPGRRTGAVMLLNLRGKLVGIFTDSDLARLLERCEDGRLDSPISEVMTKRFQTISQHSRLRHATELMAKRKISELPVVDDTGCPLGILDLTDLVGMVTPVQWTSDAAADGRFTKEPLQPKLSGTELPTMPSAEEAKIIPLAHHVKRRR